MIARLTLEEAAAVARVHVDDIRHALAAGEIRSLTRTAVEAWTRARVASIITGRPS